MKKILIFGLAFLLFVTGCQKEVTVVPAPQQQPQQQPPSNNIIVVPGRPQCPPPPPGGGIHIDINSRPGYRWCNRCGVWVHVGTPHHCR
jgi:hypothetical protein